MSATSAVPPRKPTLEGLLASPGFAARVMWAVIGIGTVLRLGAFCDRRSLWIDEAMLALNVATRSFDELHRPLEMAQLAPPLFLWIERIAVLLGGVDELALRAWPFLASIAMLGLLGAFAKRVLSPAAAICTLLFAATSHLLVYYASEAKPYGPDGLVTLMLVLPAWIVCQGGAPSATWWCLALALAVAPLLSFTAVFTVIVMIPAFVLADIGPLERRRALMLSGIGMVVTAAAIAHARSPQVGAYMDQFWEHRFVPLDRAGFTALMADAVEIARHGHFSPLDAQAARSVLSDAMDISLVATMSNHTYLYPRLLVRLYVVGSVLLTALGCWTVIARHRARSILIVGPLLAAAGANLAGQYPIAVRLWLFAAPLLIVLLVAGISAIATVVSTARRESLVVATTLVIALPVTVTAMRMLVHPLARREQSRPVVAAVRQAREAGEAVYVYPSSAPAWLVYSSEWKPEEIPALRAYARAASPDGPAFVNARERIPLTIESRSALLRSTPLGMDILGTASGVYTQYRQDPDGQVFEGWGDQEVERILEQARGCVWTFESHPKRSERAALDAALGGRGFSATQSVGDADVLATRLCRSTS